eukprot:1159500-Pelagomonas_calceolata.AAC.23
MLVGECTCAQQRNVRVYAPKRGQNDQRTDEMSGLIVHALLKQVFRTQCGCSCRPGYVCRPIPIPTPVSKPHASMLLLLRACWTSFLGPNVDVAAALVMCVGQYAHTNSGFKTSCFHSSTAQGLLDEFSGPNVDAAAALVECAGRFLRRSPESRVRAENLMEVLTMAATAYGAIENPHMMLYANLHGAALFNSAVVMMRLKGVRHLDNRQAALVEGAFYAATAPKGEEEKEWKGKEREGYASQKGCVRKG